MAAAVSDETDDECRGVPGMKQSPSSGPARRATRNDWLRTRLVAPEFIGVCLGDGRSGSTAPESEECRLRWLPSWCLVSLLASRREDRVPRDEAKRWRLRFTEERETWHKKVAG